MMYTVKILPAAWRDLDRISDKHLFLVGPGSAKKVTDGILDVIDTLKISPEGYAALPDKELAAMGYRMALYKNYVSVYKINGDTVFVYHIFDARTDYPKIIKFG